ncbi:MAG: hypothetical protein V3S48_07905, partial [Candidatus Neomarinimicrobiota bacterium]
RGAPIDAGGMYARRAAETPGAVVSDLLVSRSGSSPCAAAASNTQHRITNALIGFSLSLGLTIYSQLLISRYGDQYHYLTLFNSGLQGIENELKALNPHKILERGYSLAFKNDGSIVRAESNLKRGEDFILRTGQGSLLARKKKSIDYLDNKL